MLNGACLTPLRTASRTPSAASSAEHQHAGKQAADEEILDGDVLRDDAVEDERHRQREEQAERARGGEQADREALAIALFEQRRQQQSAKREDRDTGAAGEQREERAQRGRGDGRAAGCPPEQGAQRAQQPLRRLAFGEEEAGQREERNRREVCRRRRELFEGLDERHDRPAAVGEEPHHRDAAQQREDRRAERTRDEDRDEPRQQRAPLEEVVVVCGEDAEDESSRRDRASDPVRGRTQREPRRR